MSSNKGTPAFPDAEAKLQKPAKQSAFERQRAEAEAKRKREAAETAAVYQDFVKSFENDDGNERTTMSGSYRHPPQHQPGFASSGQPVPGASRRHFGTSGLKSGPGSLGPAPTSFGKKRSYQDFARGPRAMAPASAGQNGDGAAKAVPSAFDASDDEEAKDTVDRAEEKATAKPTMRLWDLPPGASPAMLKALISEYLPVESVTLLPPSGPGTSERKSSQAVAIFPQETPSSDVDSAVTSLKGRYLGFGYHLSVDRGPSTAILSTTMQRHNLVSLTASMPFDAKPVEQNTHEDNPAGYQGGKRGFAPPSSYNTPLGNVNRAKLLHVPVNAPRDIKMVQIINKVVEGVLEHGPEFEALLMTRTEVQCEEKWAWIWNARSEGGIWYRWRLWEIITGSPQARRKNRFIPLFDGSYAWKTPKEHLPFEFVTKLEDFASDSDYDSSDDDDVDEEGNREGHQIQQDERTFLNPIRKARLVHLLARLPRSMTKLRKGDIARVTTFAITNASRGADEIVDLILSNVEHPFSLSGAHHKDRKSGTREPQPGAGGDEPAASEAYDAGAASLVGLYVVSDILSSSSTTNVRHGWRYRALLESAIMQRKTFERLGVMAEKLGWGRLRAEKWKRSVHLVLNLWEGWCSFATDVHEKLVQSFDNPPTSKSEEQEDESLKKGRWNTSWKLVEATPAAVPASEPVAAQAMTDPPTLDGDGKKALVEGDGGAGDAVAEGDVDGEAIGEDDVDGESIDEEDIHGEPLDEDDLMDDGDSSEEEKPETKGNDAKDKKESTPPQPAPTGRARQRMRAADMFADSDDSATGDGQ